MLRIIRPTYEKMDYKKLLKEWDAEEQKYVNSIMLEDGDGCYGYKFAADTIEAAKAGFHEVIWMAIELKQYRSGQDFSVNSFIEDGDGKYVESDRKATSSSIASSQRRNPASISTGRWLARCHSSIRWTARRASGSSTRLNN